MAENNNVPQYIEATPDFGKDKGVSVRLSKEGLAAFLKKNGPDNSIIDDSTERKIYLESAVAAIDQTIKDTYSTDNIPLFGDKGNISAPKNKAEINKIIAALNSTIDSYKNDQNKRVENLRVGLKDTLIALNLPVGKNQDVAKATPKKQDVARAETQNTYNIPGNWNNQKKIIEEGFKGTK